MRRSDLSGTERLAALVRTVPRLGAAQLARYGLHAARLRTGWYERRLPVGSWPAAGEGVEVSWPWPSPSQTALRAVTVEPERVTEAADRILGGECRYFSWRWLPRPSDWQSHPLTGAPPPSLHWSRIPSMSAAFGDVKWAWEPSRCDWALTLARAFVVDGDDRYRDGFWTLLRDWCEANPPNQGVNWMCGQECSLRVLALLLAGGTLRRDPDDHRLLAAVLEAHGARVDVAVEYALAQDNSHGLAEAVGLLAVASALPGAAARGRWEARGRDLFVALVRRQYDDDGVYVSNSHNYARLALRYAAAALHLTGGALPEDVRTRLRAAVRCLYEQQDPVTGRLPDYGPNDGANQLALNDCAYRDFRPVLQLVSSLLDGRRLYPPGPWDEDLLWFGLDPDALEPAPPGGRAPAFAAAQRGFYALRGAQSFATIRCHEHVQRPAHADMLHVDVWHGGSPIVADGGTFSYNDPHGWGRYLRATAAHNTLEIDGQTQMRYLGAFLPVDWTRASVLSFGPGVVDAWSGSGLEGEHYAHERDGAVHWRGLYRRGDRWLVVDDLRVERGDHAGTVRWHLGTERRWERSPAPGLLRAVADDGLEVVVQPPADGALEWLEGAGERPATLRSPRYGDAVDCVVLVARRPRAAESARWVTLIGPVGDATWGSSALRWEGLSVPLQPGLRPVPEGAA